MLQRAAAQPQAVGGPLGPADLPAEQHPALPNAVSSRINLSCVTFTAFGRFGNAASWRERGAGKRYQPLKRQCVPQQQGRGNEKAHDNPLRKGCPAREEVNQGARKPRKEVSHSSDKQFEKPLERIVGLGPSKHDAGTR
jgi:hypothetical protein